MNTTESRPTSRRRLLADIGWHREQSRLCQHNADAHRRRAEELANALGEPLPKCPRCGSPLLARNDGIVTCPECIGRSP